MSQSTPPNPRYEALRDAFASDLTKLGLSTLIIVSVLPFAWVESASLLFFGAFALELVLRVVVLRYELHTRALSKTELVMLALDVLATLSFLPLGGLFSSQGARFLRLIRLSRMLMLLSYWSPIGKEIWVIISKRERRYQLLFVASMVVILTFAAALLLYHFGNTIDFNEDNKLNDRSFWSVVWWSFRQIQDPGNMVKDASATLAFAFSLVLTTFGIFLIAFLIGIGTSVVSELVDVGRERRIGMGEHSVIANLGLHSRVLVEELVRYYRKSLRSPKLVTLGSGSARPDYMLDEELRRVRYRQGSATVLHDLIKVDSDRARRVILLGEGEEALADSQVISQILSVREINDTCQIFAELVTRDNVDAARLAGGRHTVPILTHELVSKLLADILTFPGVETLYDQLLSSRGSEVYTCIYGMGAMEKHAAPTATSQRFSELVARAHREHGVLLMGTLTGKDDDEGTYALNPQSTAEFDGLFGLANNFQKLRTCAIGLAEKAPKRASTRQQKVIIPCIEASSGRETFSKVLLCGYHQGLGDLCRELVGFSPGVEIFLFVPRIEHLYQLARNLGPSEGDQHAMAELEARLASPMLAALPGETLPPVRIVLEGGSAAHLMAGDWSEEATLTKNRGDYRLKEMEAVFFSYTMPDADPDARTALASLKLHHVARSTPERVHPRLRTLCEVLDNDKAALFSSHFTQKQKPPALVVCTEHLRHAFMAQAVFVPRVAAIYHELLSHCGQSLRRVRLQAISEEEAREVTFGELAETLQSRDGLLPLAVELPDDKGEMQIIVNPTQKLRLADIGLIYAVGDHGR
ncbi:MAG: ion transporter [Deltaproteobacteria bacterium]|nr:ion transporter [Deltaproteobacteria bacterium]